MVSEESSYLMRSACQTLLIGGATSGLKVALSSVFMLAYLLSPTELFQTGCAKEVGIVESMISSEESTAFARKLLHLPEDEGSDISGGRRRCSKSDVLIFQSPAGPLSDGIPAYTVQILNGGAGPTSHAIADIHVRCGWFSSARMINPSVFRRLDYDDCLVNDGEPLRPGKTLSFQYANTFCYPLSVSSVAC